MTVQELIEKLKTMPPDVVVRYYDIYNASTNSEIKSVYLDSMVDDSGEERFVALTGND